MILTKLPGRLLNNSQLKKRSFLCTYSISSHQIENDEEVYNSEEEHRNHLDAIATLPRGFSIGRTSFDFVPEENKDMNAKMNLTIIKLDEVTKNWGAVFTRNAACGSPVRIGKRMLKSKANLGAIVVNNKISNVCPAGAGGEEDARRVCDVVAKALNLSNDDDDDDDGVVLPSSTGVIGWRLPVDEMIDAVPRAVQNIQSKSVLPAAEAIMTTDLYPKVRSSSSIGQTDARLVGIAKGAGMIEPNLATMLVFLFTDLDIPQEELQNMLKSAADDSFNCISIDSDQSTSDTVVIVSSSKVPVKQPRDLKDFEIELRRVCADLSNDIVRNGEGVKHVMRVSVQGAPTNIMARHIGKSVVNSPLTKCAIAGNDPNVGRVIGAVGSYVGNHIENHEKADELMQSCTLRIAGEVVFSNGSFELSTEKERRLVRALQEAELYESVPEFVKNSSHVTYVPPVTFPRHDRVVNIDISFESSYEYEGSAVVIGGDLTHEYVAENADYRS